MVNRKEGLFVEKPPSQRQKEAEKRPASGSDDNENEDERQRRRWVARAEISGVVRWTARAASGHKKPDGRTRMVRSVRNSFSAGTADYLPGSCFTSAASKRSLPPSIGASQLLPAKDRASYLPGSCFTSAASKRSLPPSIGASRPSSERSSQLLAQQLLHLGGLQKVVAAETSVHRNPFRRKAGPLPAQQLFHLGGLQKVVAAEHRCIAIPSGERPGRYLPNNCFTSAATVTPL